MSRRLLITSTDMMMIQFLVPHVKYLAANGYRVDIACSQVGNRMEDVKNALGGTVEAIHEVRLERSPVSPKNFKGYGDMKRLLENNHYDIIWTNEPVMGVVTRLAARKARKQGTKVLYMVHGFHFFKGASAVNWALYYPVERLMAHMCDAIVTMNQEDYGRAQKFKTPKVYMISGVGLDTSRFTSENAKALTAEEKIALREKLGLPPDGYMLLTVGELTRRKNQQVVIRALSHMPDRSFNYVLCGKGDQQQTLEGLAKELGLSEKIHFLGYRKDIPDICRAADCFVFPSLQEGLPFALMEAMQMGLPIVCSNIRGNSDLITHKEGGLLCDTRSAEDFCAALNEICNMDRARITQINRQKLLPYGLDSVKQEIQALLEKV